MCDKEVEEWDEGAIAGAVSETRVTDITWDLEDPYFEFNDENSSRPQTPVAASIPTLIPTEGTLTGPEQLNFKEPQVENPELVLINELIPDYSGVPFVGFS